MTPELSADCAQCQGLCCMALAFDAGEMFGADKPAGQPCRHLNPDYGCAIHKQREDQGYRGCIGYDCQGAGQRVCQEVLAGLNWRDDAATKHHFLEAFQAMRQVHRLLDLLHLAGQLPLTVPQREALHALRADLCPDQWDEASLAAFQTGPLPGAVRTYLQGLRGQVPAPRA
ncbi:hypothetical protein [Halovulum sp. GXIMD14793]